MGHQHFEHKPKRYHVVEIRPSTAVPGTATYSTALSTDYRTIACSAVTITIEAGVACFAWDVETRLATLDGKTWSPIDGVIIRAAGGAP